MAKKQPRQYPDAELTAVTFAALSSLVRNKEIQRAVSFDPHVGKLCVLLFDYAQGNKLPPLPETLVDMLRDVEGVNEYVLRKMDFLNEKERQLFEREFAFGLQQRQLTLEK